MKSPTDTIVIKNVDPHVGLLATARTATLATISPSGLPRLVPVCFAALAYPDAEHGIRIYSPLDQKPKRASDPRSLARVRDIVADPRVSLLVDRWSEDWTALGWLRLECVASLLEPASGGAEHAAAVAALCERYPQYRDHELETRPLIRLTLRRVISWSAASQPGDSDG